MKYIITENKLDKVVLTWLNNNFSNLKPIVMYDSVYYVNENGKWLFSYTQDRKKLFVNINYDRIWSILVSIFDLRYEQIQNVLKEWLEETYHIIGLTPITSESSLWFA